MKKADNIFVRAKAYVKEHPRTSFQDAIQKVKRKKVSGTAKISHRSSQKSAMKPGRKAAVAGVKKSAASHKNARVSGKTVSVKQQLLDAFLKIDQLETQLAAERGKTAKRDLINKINSMHDRVDRLKSSFIN